MEKFMQTMTKINCNDSKELIGKVNKLGAVSNMPIEIIPTTPDFTDTKYWYAVNYWVRIY